MKILFLNAGYFTTINGVYHQYLTYAYRYLRNTKKIKENFLSEFNKIIADEDPDVICLVEVKKRDLAPLLINHQHHLIRNKYGRSGQNSAAILTKEPSLFTHGFTKRGSKKLIITSHLLGKKIACVHLALSKSARKNQVRQISTEYRDCIIAGDFNTTCEHEMAVFNKTHFISNLGPTFPSHHPKKQLDYFLIPKEYGENFTIRKIKSKISDHLPIVLEI